MSAETKQCRKCEKVKLLDDFWDLPNGKPGKRARCKECMGKTYRVHIWEKLAKDPKYNSNRLKEWRERTGDNRRRNLRENYGMTLEDYCSMLHAQDDKCAICGEAFDEDRDAAVDHDHETGKVRGIVHSRCNSGIGFLKESPQICRMAAVYLEKHGKG